MSFWSFLGELALLEWLFGSRKQDEVAAPQPSRSYDYGREDDYFDKIHSMRWKTFRRRFLINDKKTHHIAAKTHSKIPQKHTVDLLGAGK